MLRRSAILGITFLALLGTPTWLSVREQQSGQGWSVPEVIAETAGQLGGCVALVADGYGHLHLFYPHKVDQASSSAIDYLYWDGAEWSEPIDILVDPRGGDAACPHAAIDAQNVVHLLWLGYGNSLNHSAAPLARAGSARAWSDIRRLAVSFPEVGLALGLDGTLSVAYADYPPTGAVRLIQSRDGGTNWSYPVTVGSVISETQTAPNEVRLAVDGRGRLHAVWTEYRLPNGWPPSGTFYTRSLDGGESWDPPLRTSGENHGQIGVGTAGQDGVHLVWRSTIGGDGTFHQYSTDGGETWSAATRYDDRGGFSGLPSFARDTAGGVHFVTGGGTYGLWQESGPGTYESLRSEETTAQAKVSGGERAILAIALGNQLHVVFETDFNKLWHRSKQLDAPALPTAAPRATGTPPATRPAPTATAAPPTSTPAARGTLAPALIPSGSGASGAVVGILASAVVVLVAVAASLLARRRGRGWWSGP